jgi:glycosyltransferase involved in cell wall biosynthesis
VTPIGDPDALAEAIRRVIQDPQQYSRPRRQIEDTFSLERTVAGYEALFRALLAGESWNSQPIEASET